MELISTVATTSQNDSIFNQGAHSPVYMNALGDGVNAFVAGDVLARLTVNGSLTGDTTSSLGTATITGANDDNTDDGILYWKLFEDTSIAAACLAFELYKDSALTTTSMVSRGYHTAFETATITLSAAYSSGLSGSVAIIRAASTGISETGTFITDQIRFQKYDATGSNQQVIGVVEDYNTANYSIRYGAHGVVRFTSLNVTNGGGKDDEVVEELRKIGIFAV